MEIDLETIKNKLKNWQVPDTNELKKIIRVLSMAYLYRKNSIFPTEEDIALEFKRRENWLNSIQKESTGEKGFYLELEAIWIDPPADFK